MRKKKKSKQLYEQLSILKGKAVSILSTDLLFDYEEEVVMELYNLIDKVITNKVDDKHYSVEELVDMRLIEYAIVLEPSENVRVKRLSELLKIGIKW